jgi:transglutaminase-like putative cysteine protease
MLKINLSNTKFLSLVILGICLLSISENVSLANKIFWVVITIGSIFINKFKFRFKSFLLSIYAVGLLYAQFIFNQYIFSEEFFINCLGVLLIVKYAELDNKNNLLSYNLICMVLSVASLISGQDILSSIISLSIIILLVINMYLIQQKEVMDFNIKNILKYLGFGFSIFPIIIIFYLIFPRAEINFRLFDPSKSSLGIPDTIRLGSFESFANSDEKVFTLINQNYKKEDLYFRVKIFDYMEEDKSWRPSSSYYLYNTYKNSIKISGYKAIEEKYQIILEPYKRKWIPVLDNSRLTDQSIKITEDPFNQTFISLDPIDRKKQLEFQKYQINYQLGKPVIDYYTLLPQSVSNELVDWVKTNKQSRSNTEYLNHILSTFADGSYYYNLSPENNSQNSYADFFFRGKEGYCEYFAGTFVLLARLANIPSRIVSGYYGGELNTVGDFYEFRQRDTHAWAEVWLNGKGWVRVDPTSVIPGSNVRNSLNNIFNDEDNNAGSIFTLKIFKNLSYYITYADFVWTRHLLSYDNNKRKSFIKDIINFQFSNILYWIFAPILIFIVLRLFFKINKANILTWMLNYIIWTSKKENKVLNSDTHQEVLKKLKLDYQKKYQSFFYLYESFRYQNQNIELTTIFRTFMSAK